jgi:hypothetical protein
MKRNHPISLFNADNPPKTKQQESSAPAAQKQTPFLKEILSGPVNMFTRENEATEANPDRLAALRYIRESALIRKLYAGKMSC